MSSEILKKYFTNPYGQVSVVHNLPQNVIGALFSRYSRSPDLAEDIFIKEFYEKLEEGVDVKKAEDFYSRVLDGFGDDSIADLGGVHIAIQNISNVLTKIIEDCRLMGVLEKSSRYVLFDRKINGEYCFHREPFLMKNFREEYLNLMNELFDSYSEFFSVIFEHVKEKYPQAKDEDERAFLSSRKAKALDNVKSLLPASTLTNVGIYVDGRELEYLLLKLYSSDLSEAKSVADKIFEEASKIVPSFIRRANDEKYGRPAQGYYRKINESIKKLNQGGQNAKSEASAPVTLVFYDEEADVKFLSHLLFASNQGSLLDLKKKVESMDENQRFDLIKSFVDRISGLRENRRNKAPRFFENISYTFEILANYGVYRDLQRHRMLTQERQLLSTENGFYTPELIKETGLEKRFSELMMKAKSLYEKACEKNPYEAQYMVPFAFNVRWYIKMNLREAVHLLELRSSKQGQKEYREIAQQMFREIERVNPAVAGFLKFVDLNSYDLERKDHEIRISEKMAKS